ncbi:MAG: protoporphyrinogen oxidase [Vulcanimicrobiaceae bacterium]
MSVQRIVVLGGGISGLAAAYRSRELAEQHRRRVEITVLERSTRVGGCIQTRYDEGFVLEMGPDSLITEKPAAIDLASRVGLEGDITPVLSEYRGARVVRAGRLIPVPDDFRLFTPLSLGGLITSRLFTPAGMLRAAMEPFIPVKRSVEDESLSSFVTRRFGREILDRLAQPLIGGIYSGDPERLSMQATLPQLLYMERTHGSLVHGMRSAMQNPQPAASPHRMVSLRGGLGTLVAALERELRASIRTSSEAVRLQRRSASGQGWTITLSDRSEVEADAVICALPADASARLLDDLEPQAAALLRTITYHSVATVTIIFASDDIPKLPRCTGFVVPHTEGRSIMATTFSSQKYVNRAPAGFAVLRAFVGGALQPAMAALDEAELIDMVRKEFRELLGITARPRMAIVHRHPGALPEYSLGHTSVVNDIEGVVALLGNFALAGSAYRGVGIADCVRSGERAAEEIVAVTPLAATACRAS